MPGKAAGVETGQERGGPHVDDSGVARGRLGAGHEVSPDEDLVPDLAHRREPREGHGQELAARLGVAGGERHLVPLLELEGLAGDGPPHAVVLKLPLHVNLSAEGVDHHATESLGALAGLREVPQAPLVELDVAPGEVNAGRGHPGVEKPRKRVHVVARWTESSANLGSGEVLGKRSRWL